MDLDNNPEFQLYLQSQNPTAATIAYIEEQLQPEIKRGFEMMFNASMMAMQKVKDDAARGVTNGNVENQEPEAPKTTRGKRSLRTSAVNPAPDTVIKSAPATKRKPVTQSTVIKKSAVPKAASSKVEDASMMGEIPKGKILIEVFPGPSGFSPYAGLVFLVEPLPPKASHNKHCNIGRSCAKDFKAFGVSMPNDLEVSTRHGVIHRVNKDFYYKDLGSSNGTTDVATRTTLEPLEPTKLENGTQLQMGQSILKFNFSS
jgi:FHA domain